MVVDGQISVRLVNAETKEPFKEHMGDSGNVFVEAEPDAEYFIEILYDDEQKSDEDENQDDDDALEDEDIADKHSPAVFMEFSVDGKKLQAPLTLSPSSETYYAGIWSCNNGTSKERALRFQIPASGGVLPDGEELVMGSVVVDVFEAIPNGTRALLDCEGDFVSSSPVKGNIAKLLRSGQGSTCETETMALVSQVFKRGRLLRTISVKCCTALGLIHVGVLPKPPVWEYLRMRKPATQETTSSNFNYVEPTRVKRGGTVVDGVEIEPPQECEFFDLAVLSDDDEESGKEATEGAQEETTEEESDGKAVVSDDEASIGHDVGKARFDARRGSQSEVRSRAATVTAGGESA
ncbi:expressed unknown protein [Seminavis robusta]|uniref:Uncharacterized protein n=1 Tax=Seminavis robusta TaxID=568900 RepID=A0A9N8DWE4_9STRA|nr:expressed unknown protein [Seminavis robusta]|eukprot:Sro324_g117550.1 n/a (350) ;mRNA; r:35175-36224